jgi:hypothetical protein
MKGCALEHFYYNGNIKGLFQFDFFIRGCNEGILSFLLFPPLNTAIAAMNSGS